MIQQKEEDRLTATAWWYLKQRLLFILDIRNVDVVDLYEDNMLVAIDGMVAQGTSL